MIFAQGQVILISGGTTGIERAIARLLVQDGADVAIFGRDEQDLENALIDTTYAALSAFQGSR